MLGKPVAGDYSRRYCGDGTLAGCREVLRASLTAAVQPGAVGAGRHDVAALTYDKHQDDIRHTAIAVAGVPAIDWQNRPTFQQVVSFTSSRRTVAAGGQGPTGGTGGTGGGAGSGTGTAARPGTGALATTGLPAAVPLLGLGLLAGAVLVRRRRRA